MLRIMKTTDVHNYHALVVAGDEHLLIDVREPAEWDTCHLDHARHVPLRSLPNAVADLEDWRDKPVYCLCHHGMRSQQAAQFLEQQGFSDVTNVAGGIHAWATEIDPAMPTYR